MDIVDNDAARACKRQKRSNSKDVSSGDCSHEAASAESNGDYMLIGMQANYAINSNNNNNGETELQKQQTEESVATDDADINTKTEQAVEQNIEDNESGSPQLLYPFYYEDSSSDLFLEPLPSRFIKVSRSCKDVEIDLNICSDSSIEHPSNSNNNTNETDIDVNVAAESNGGSTLIGKESNETINSHNNNGESKLQKQQTEESVATDDADISTETEQAVEQDIEDNESGSPQLLFPFYYEDSSSDLFLEPLPSRFIKVSRSCKDVEIDLNICSDSSIEHPSNSNNNTNETDIDVNVAAESNGGSTLIGKESNETINSHNNNGESKLQKQQTKESVATDDADISTETEQAVEQNIEDNESRSPQLVLPFDYEDSSSNLFLETHPSRLITVTSSSEDSEIELNISSDSPIEHPNGSHDTNETDVDLNGANELLEAEENRESRSSAADDSSSSPTSALWLSGNAESDSDDYNEGVTNPANEEQIRISVNKVMCKSKPSYNWNLEQELMPRENNLFNRIGWRGGHTSVSSFGQGYYASRQVVERMKLMTSLSRHRCCVNCLSFNRSGDLICSGSDDLRIIVWDWAKGKPRHSFLSGHNLNIFQTKFIDSAGCLDIVSSSRDGQVRRAVIPPSGSSSIMPIPLYSHKEAAHKLVVVPHSCHEIMSAGEDSTVKHFDLRSNCCTTMLRCYTKENRRVRLFSIAHHPFASEFCISGSDDKLRVYDKRKLDKTVHEMSPKDTKVSQITCAVYNHSGSEILASYSDAAIYLFDSRNYKDGEFLHSYEGHINSRTIKGVNFFGPHSEHIISGSDDGNIFYWDKNTEAVTNFMKGDDAGVVNCLEQHPTMPVLATSGLDHNVKIWTPSAKPETEVPCSEALKETLHRNFRRNVLMDGGDFDIHQIHYFIRRLIEPGRNLERAEEYMSQRNLGISSSSDSSSNSSSSNSNWFPGSRRQRTRGNNSSSSDEVNANPNGCRPQ